MSIALKIAALALGAAFAGLAGSANALPASGAAAPLPEGAAKIEKVERTCRPDGYCYNKYTGAPMGYAQPQPRYYAPPQPRYYAPQPRVYVEPEYPRPRRYYERRDYY